MPAMMPETAPPVLGFPGSADMAISDIKGLKDIICRDHGGALRLMRGDEGRARQGFVGIFGDQGQRRGGAPLLAYPAGETAARLWSPDCLPASCIRPR
ncbi:hypothetical protein IT41_10625 [Paracoccus halophilus]|uniref:Uncharacterized protein n=1 Tax=Paracoccus halophilus TaxID=376733 RepID=A0A099F256_9RHOB|nr:hypothetical protein IT41_10625 [Paracoccus halophilus]